MSEHVSQELPSEAELKQVEQIRSQCLQEIKALSCKEDDVVGDLRICRFLRAKHGDATAAATWFREFLQWRVGESEVDTARREVIGRTPEDFIKWFMKRRNPYFPLCPYAGRTEDGHVLWIIHQGYVDAKQWVEHRQVSKDEDIRVINQIMEWTLWHLNELSRAEGRMCHVIKVCDFQGLACEGRSLPLFVPEFKKMVKEQMGRWQIFYCEHDVKIVMLNPSLAFRVLFQLVKLILTKRQLSKVCMLGDTTTPDVLQELRSFVPGSCLPELYGGTVTFVPGCLPRPSKSEIEEWYRVRHLVPKEYPELEPPAEPQQEEEEQLEEEVPMKEVPMKEEVQVEDVLLEEAAQVKPPGAWCCRAGP